MSARTFSLHAHENPRGTSQDTRGHIRRRIDSGESAEYRRRDALDALRARGDRLRDDLAVEPAVFDEDSSRLPAGHLSTCNE